MALDDLRSWARLSDADDELSILSDIGVNAHSVHPTWLDRAAACAVARVERGALEPCQLSIRSIPAHDHCRPSTLTIGLASHAASSLAAIFVDR